MAERIRPVILSGGAGTFAAGHFINAVGMALGVALLVIDDIRLRAGRKLAVP